MGLGGILILLLLLVSLIVFIYVLVITARGWGWLHSILLSLLFIECWVMIAFSAGVQYRRVTATEQAHKNREAAEKALAQTQQLLWGGFNTDPDALDAVVPVQGKLRRLTAERGRVWRQLNLLQQADGLYQLELSVADAGAAPDAAADEVLAEEPVAAAPAAAAPSSESLPVNTVVYAFAEQLNEAGQAMPVYYLGEFVVKQSQAGQVSLAPTLELYPEQRQRIESGNAPSWTLYELLPLDSHSTYALSGPKSTEDPAFGPMDEEAIRSTFASVPNDGNRQERLIDSYLRDGQRANDSDPAESVWVQVNVLKEAEFDVDSEEVANATERGYYDSSGRSIDTRLKRGDDGVVKLTPDTKGQRIILREEVAMPLINSGVLELVQRVYIRPLIDYEEAIVHHMVRDHEVSEAIALAKRDSAEIQKANQLGQEMISFRQVEEQELKSDLSNFQRELQVLEQAIASSTSEVDDLRAEIQRLYQSIQAQHAAIVGRASGTVSVGN